MRIGKPESKDNLRFQDIKVGETFRPKECWTEEDEKEIFIKIREICDNSGVYGGTTYMDAKRMCWCIECVDVSYAISKCKPKNIIFEFGQGILLDCDNLEYAPHLTCAKTGLDGINQLWNQDYKLILNDAKNVNAYYVTRTYLTRHGIGRLDSECTRNDISDKMEEDKTNVPNPFQNHLRYAPLDYDSLVRRIFIDSEVYNVDVNIVFTHCNELPVKLEELNNAIQGYFESNVHVYEQFSEKESFENLKNYFLKSLDKT